MGVTGMQQLRGPQRLLRRESPTGGNKCLTAKPVQNTQRPVELLISPKRLGGRCPFQAVFVKVKEFAEGPRHHRALPVENQSPASQRPLVPEAFVLRFGGVIQDIEIGSEVLFHHHIPV